MNIKAVWKDPDRCYHTERVVIVGTEWRGDILTALVVDVNGYFKCIPINELLVTDKNYLPS